jgi:very-short-patch-repair endonuclease
MDQAKFAAPPLTTLPQDKHLLDRARRLRNGGTPFEAILWPRISRSQLGGYKFRRQHVIGNCIVDFFCPQKALIVEIDGDRHEPVKDSARGEINRMRGYRTLRFTNVDIATNIDGVLQHLLSALEALPDRWLTPTPPQKGRGRSCADRHEFRLSAARHLSKNPTDVVIRARLLSMEGRP